MQGSGLCGYCGGKSGVPAVSGAKCPRSFAGVMPHQSEIIKTAVSVIGCLYDLIRVYNQSTNNKVVYEVKENEI